MFQSRSCEEINRRMNKESNKVKEEGIKLEDNYEDNQTKRSRGRPKGVKNKKNKMIDDLETNMTHRGKAYKNARES